MSQDDLEVRMPWKCATLHHHDQVVPWCEANIGEFDRDWYRYGTDIASGVVGWEPCDYYRFRREKDAVIFKLKWS